MRTSTRLLAVLLVPSLSQTASAQKAGPVFEDGQAQKVEAFSEPDEWISHDLWVVTEFDSDGDGKLDRMHVDVTRPGQTDSEDLKVPVVYESSPYFSGVGSTESKYFWDPKHELGDLPPLRDFQPPVRFTPRRPLISRSHINDWVPRGFAVVHSESPGTGLSQGCPTVGGKNESLAPKAVIDWLNGRAKGYTTPDGDEEVEAYWCTGKVGMTGTSYNGTLPVAAATTGVEGLEAIIPVAANTSYYHYYRSNGLVRHPGGYMGEDVDVLYEFINSGDPEMRDYCNENVRDMELMENADRITGDWSDWWAARDYLTQLENYRAATLVAHAWNDWNVMPEHGVRLYEALLAKGLPVQFFFHQGGHGGPPPMRMMNRWFTRYLYGVENGVENDPKSWIVRERDRMNEPTAYPDYPHPDAEQVVLYPTKGGNKIGGLTPVAGESQKPEKLVDDAGAAGADLAGEKSSKNRLIYATPELERDLHLSGTARIRVRLASSKPAVNLSIWIVSLPWESGGPITDNVITRGWCDPQNRHSLTESEPLKRGEMVDVEFDLQPDDQVIGAGQRIGLMIMASDKDHTLWPKAGTELTIDLDGTSLSLPVVGGAPAFAEATGLSAE